MTTIVVGASRGLGRGIAKALAELGPVVAVSRDARTLAALAGTELTPEVADAAEHGVAERLIAAHHPDRLVVVAGAQPHPLPLHEHTWETFAVNWEADVKIAFEWLSAALRAPLHAGSRVIVISSGASIAGSPLSGGYAGAKATQRFITRYAQEESDRAGLGITFTAVLPKITPATDLGLHAIHGYAERAGITVEQYLAQHGAALTPESAGQAIAGLFNEQSGSSEFLLTGTGIQPLP